MIGDLINPFDIMSGKVVQNRGSTFWFEEPGSNMYEPDKPKHESKLLAIKTSNSYTQYNQKGQHSYNDLPNIQPDGSHYWYKDGEFHRDNDLPAMMREDGTYCWYRNGVLHRDNDLPAMILNSYSKDWLLEGSTFYDPSLWNHQPSPLNYNPINIDAVETPSLAKTTTKRWCKNGVLHRGNDLPAVEYSNGRLEWWVEGKLITTNHISLPSP